MYKMNVSFCTLEFLLINMIFWSSLALIFLHPTFLSWVMSPEISFSVLQPSKVLNCFSIKNRPWGISPGSSFQSYAVTANATSSSLSEVIFYSPWFFLLVFTFCSIVCNFSCGAVLNALKNSIQIRYFS